MFPLSEPGERKRILAHQNNIMGLIFHIKVNALGMRKSSPGRENSCTMSSVVSRGVFSSQEQTGAFTRQKTASWEMEGVET